MVEPERRTGTQYLKSLLKGLFWLVWSFMVALFLQSTVASFREHEPRAAVIFGGIALTILLAGGIAWFNGRRRSS